MIKFQPQLRTIGKRPVLIVGERPGKQRKNDETFQAFHGNRTGDFIEELIKDYGNIILTNVIPYQESEFESMNDLFFDGIYDLRKMIEKYNPKRIIAFGKIAKDAMSVLDTQDGKSCLADDCFVFYMPHPSWVLRFNKDIGMYQKTIETLLKGNKFASL